MPTPVVVPKRLERLLPVNFDLLVVNLSLAGEDPLKLVSLLRASDTTHETPLLLIGEVRSKSTHSAWFRTRRERLAVAARRPARTASPSP